LQGLQFASIALQQLSSSLTAALQSQPTHFRARDCNSDAIHFPGPTSGQFGVQRTFLPPATVVVDASHSHTQADVHLDPSGCNNRHRTPQSATISCRHAPGWSLQSRGGVTPPPSPHGISASNLPTPHHALVFHLPSANPPAQQCTQHVQQFKSAPPEPPPREFATHDQAGNWMMSKGPIRWHAASPLRSVCGASMRMGWVGVSERSHYRVPLPVRCRTVLSTVQGHSDVGSADVALAQQHQAARDVECHTLGHARGPDTFPVMTIV
jgi:hypothetical protein